MGGDGSAIGSPLPGDQAPARRRREAADSLELAAAVRSAYRAVPRPLARAPEGGAGGPALPAGEVRLDALRVEVAARRTRPTIPLRVLAAGLVALGLVAAAAALPRVVLGRDGGPAAPPRVMPGPAEREPPQVTEEMTYDPAAGAADSGPATVPPQGAGTSPAADQATPRVATERRTASRGSVTSPAPAPASSPTTAAGQPAPEPADEETPEGGGW